MRFGVPLGRVRGDVVVPVLLRPDDKRCVLENRERKTPHVPRVFVADRAGERAQSASSKSISVSASALPARSRMPLPRQSADWAGRRSGGSSGRTFMVRPSPHCSTSTARAAPSTRKTTLAASKVFGSGSPKKRYGTAGRAAPPALPRPDRCTQPEGGVRSIPQAAKSTVSTPVPIQRFIWPPPYAKDDGPRHNRVTNIPRLKMARPGGFEPPTYRLEGGCSVP